MSDHDSKKKPATGSKTYYPGPYLKAERTGQEFYVEIGDQRRKTKGTKLANDAR